MNTISGIGQIAIAILIAAVILGLGATILNKMQATQTDAVASTITDQEFAWPGNNTEVAFDTGDLNRIITGSVLLLANGTAMEVNTNFTTTSVGVSVINTSGNAVWDDYNFSMSYGWNFGSSARNASGFGKTGMSTMSEFIPMIAIIAMAAIVIGIILVFFGRKKDQEVA